MGNRVKFQLRKASIAPDCNHVENGSGSGQPAVTANYTILTVQPPTATIEIDGQPQQVEDGTVVTMLKLGQHTWQAKAAGSPRRGLSA